MERRHFLFPHYHASPFRIHGHLLFVVASRKLYNITMSRPPSLPRLYPWYVHAVLGFFISPFTPWMLIFHALWHSSRKTALTFAIMLNLVAGACIYLFFRWAAFPWWILNIILIVLTVSWSLAAAVFQRMVIGPAGPFLKLALSRHIIGYLLFSLLLACCIGFTISLFTMFGETATLEANGFDRVSILWGAFRGVLFALPFGIFAALGLADIGERMRPIGLIAAIAGCACSIGGILLAGYGLNALLVGDFFPVGISLEQIIPLGDASPMRWMLDYDFIELGFVVVVLALFFCNIAAFHQFFKRVGIVLLGLLWLLPTFSAEPAISPQLQKRILSDLSNPRQNVRLNANKALERFLSVYPGHTYWSILALRNADMWYETGHTDKARTMWKKIIDKGGGQARDARQVSLARESLAGTAGSSQGDSAVIDIPLLDYEDYLDETWMAFMNVVHYWEHASTGDAKIKMRLKPFSEKDNALSLSRNPSAAILDDIARSWGYRVSYVPASSTSMRSLIRSKFPVLYPVFSTPALCYGFEERRSRLRTYWFSRLSRQSRAKEPSAGDIVSSDSMRTKPSHRLDRMALECRSDRNLRQIDSLMYGYSEPVAMVIHPDSLHLAVARCSGMVPEKLDSFSEGFRSILVGLDYLDKKNPQKALAWFCRAHFYNARPFADYGEHLSFLQWKDQRSSVLGNLRLDRYLAPLARYNDAFSSAKTQRRLDSCGLLFKNARTNGYLPAAISSRYFETIHLSSPPERRAGIAWAQRELAINPGNTTRWHWLCKAAAWEGDSTLQVKACSTFVNLVPDHTQMRLTLARLLVRLGDIDKADKVLACLATDSVKSNPDYLFCLGAVAEHEGSLTEAESYYKTCCAMRRYAPQNFIAHARVCSRLGKADQEKKDLAWAEIIAPSPVPLPTKGTDEQTGKQ
jgi:hypothetical protein